ncbi:unnamed protein product, partial [Larinioides sclopetarius]
PCGFPNCDRRFLKLTSLKSHTSRDHHKLLPKGFQSLNYQCSFNSCQKHCASKGEIIKHLQDHIRRNEIITCPFEKCNIQFRNRSTFSSHLTRKHAPRPPTSEDSFQSQMVKNTDNDVDAIEMPTACNDQIEEIKKFPCSIKTRLGLLCLKLMSRYHLPVTVIDAILNEIKDIHELCNGNLMQIMHFRLQKFKDLEESHINELLNLVTRNNLLSDVLSVKGSLMSDRQRRLYFKQNFSYIEPVEYVLGRNKNNKTCTFHYIPIVQSILTFISNHSVNKQLENPLATNNKILSDFIDGTVYTSNDFFKSDSLKILLYQDSFETVNPLGSGKTKHKILAIYYTLGNIYPWFRSKVEPLQLVLLCRQRDFDFFGHEAVLRPLVEDLKSLEEGINDKGKVIQGSLLAIIGDNLGSHCIGGFVESFSSTYSCRYCLVSKQNMFSENFYLKFFEIRDKENYQKVLKDLSDSNLSHLKGLKFNSIFNELKYFHVCQPGLPPCLGHDLFEGVIAYDMFLFVKTLIQEKHISSVDIFNRKIANFKLGSSDCCDKPCELKEKSSRLSGHAAQNWAFLRFFSIIFWDVFESCDSKMLYLVSLLHRIVEIVCAPKVTIQQVCFLQDLIEDYLEARIEAFPQIPLRPKHHYLTHYPVLIQKFGPLIRMWTMRFESKHSYFKKCIKSAQNFKNLTKTLSERHQFLQAYISTNEIFNDKPILPDSASTFDINLYDKNVQKIIIDKIGICNDAVVSQNICYRGIQYKTNMYLPISRIENNIVFGKILFILVINEKICFVVYVHKSFYSSKTNLYNLENSENLPLKSMFFEELIDYYPLHSYSVYSENLISLKHSIVDDFN